MISFFFFCHAAQNRTYDQPGVDAVVVILFFSFVFFLTSSSSSLFLSLNLS